MNRMIKYSLFYLPPPYVCPVVMPKFMYEQADADLTMAKANEMMQT